MMRVGLAEHTPPLHRHRVYAEGYVQLLGQENEQAALQAFGAVDFLLAAGLVVGLGRHASGGDSGRTTRALLYPLVWYSGLAAWTLAHRGPAVKHIQTMATRVIMMCTWCLMLVALSPATSDSAKSGDAASTGRPSSVEQLASTDHLLKSPGKVAVPPTPLLQGADVVLPPRPCPVPRTLFVFFLPLASPGSTLGSRPTPEAQPEEACKHLKTTTRSTDGLESSCFWLYFAPWVTTNCRLAQSRAFVGM